MVEPLWLESPQVAVNVDNEINNVLTFYDAFVFYVHRYEVKKWDFLTININLLEGFMSIVCVCECMRAVRVLSIVETKVL